MISRMMSVEQALDKILSNIKVLDVEERPILECLGQVLAEDVYAEYNVPPLDDSAFDGYAVRAEDTRGASQKSPRVLRVIDTVLAGSISKLEVKPGTAIRIMTGAPVPKGANAIVKFEDTDESKRQNASGGIPSEIAILREAKADGDIRKAGESVAKGSLILAKGAVIKPPMVGVLATQGRRKVKVIRRPVVAILATGNEIVDIKKPLPKGKIYDSNTYSIAAQVMQYGGVPKVLGIAPDNETRMRRSFQKALDTDMLLTIGGVSMGDYDVVKDVLTEQGEMLFWKVKMKPGKPLAFGRIRGPGANGKTREIPHIGLPGNPTSCMVSFEVFCRPTLLKMMGRTNLAKPTIEAVMESRIPNKDGRRTFARVIVERREDKFFARLTGPQGSGILTSMVLANGLAIIPEDKAQVEPGEKLQVMLLDCVDGL